jgi:hypothetical protein
MANIWELRHGNRYPGTWHQRAVLASESMRGLLGSLMLRAEEAAELRAAGEVAEILDVAKVGTG